LEDAPREEKDEFMRILRLRKSSILPQLEVVVDAFYFIVDELTSLKKLNIENEPIFHQNAEEAFSGLSMEEFRHFFSEATRE
jgi:hypothetical protein